MSGKTLSGSTILADDEALRAVRVAILFQRFGPYHHARVNAAGQIFAVWGVEACATEDIYAWKKVEGAGAFKKITLTDRDSGDLKWRREVCRKMWRTLDEIKPQVVVIPGWIFADALSALWWCMKTGTLAVIMSESSAGDEGRVPWKEWVKGRLVRLCAAGLAGGQPHVDYLVQLGLPREQVFTGYDVVDNGYFSTRAGEARSNDLEIRKKLNLPEKYFLASARFVEKKNLLRLIRAYARYRELAAKSEIWKLVLLGDGPLKPDLERLVSDLKLGDCVQLPGFKQYDELPVYFGLAGAFVHASTTEQWGLVVNEAMASRLPVLVSNRCGCAQDLVQEGVNGFTFDPCDVDKLANLMLRVSDFQFPLSDFGAASARIISAWGPERFGRGLKAAVEEAMKTKRRPVHFMDSIILNVLLRSKLRYKI